MKVVGAVITFRSPFMHQDRLALRGNKHKCLKSYLEWWKSYGHDKSFAKMQLIDIKWKYSYA